MTLYESDASTGGVLAALLAGEPQQAQSAPLDVDLGGSWINRRLAALVTHQFRRRSDGCEITSGTWSGRYPPSDVEGSRQSESAHTIAIQIGGSGPKPVGNCRRCCRVKPGPDRVPNAGWIRRGPRSLMLTDNS